MDMNKFWEKIITFCKSQDDIEYQLGCAARYYNHNLAMGLSYREEADSLGEDHDMYDILMTAEKRWYEVE